MMKMSCEKFTTQNERNEKSKRYKRICVNEMIQALN